jgi:hypothetical protein
MRRLVVLLGLALLACGGSTAVGVGPAPSRSPSASPSPGATPAATDLDWTLRYKLLDQYPNFSYCDPDSYPVARTGDQQSSADDWWSRNRTTPEAHAILAYHHWTDPLTPEQRLTAYQEHKKLTVILTTRTTGGYDYTLSISTAGNGAPDVTVSGTISDAGAISERSRTPRPGGCPICLEAVTRIATPSGATEVALLQAGDLVESIDGAGRRVPVRVERLIRRPTAGPHLMTRLALADGRILIAAGAHPTADGRLLRDLRAGERFDASVIASVDYVASSAPATYDILPASATGEYWANGILVGSTLNAHMG